MLTNDPTHLSHIATIEHNGRRCTVVCRISFVGFVFVGRLWFAVEVWTVAALPDRAAIPGRSRDEVLDQARTLTPSELSLRYRRALAEKRRFLKLRHVTEDI